MLIQAACRGAPHNSTLDGMSPQDSQLTYHVPSARPGQPELFT
jgi:hypothetical protein